MTTTTEGKLIMGVLDDISRKLSNLMSLYEEIAESISFVRPTITEDEPFCEDEPKFNFELTEKGVEAIQNGTPSQAALARAFDGTNSTTFGHELTNDSPDPRVFVGWGRHYEATVRDLTIRPYTVALANAVTSLPEYGALLGKLKSLDNCIAQGGGTPGTPFTPEEAASKTAFDTYGSRQSLI